MCAQGSRSSPVPLYLQIADAIRQRIMLDVWPAGSSIPTLEELALEFNVARVTVRQAVQLLTSEGILAPRRGKGTLVNGLSQLRIPVKMVATLDELGDMYRSTTPELLLMEEYARRPAMNKKEGKLCKNYIYMKRLHRQANIPYCVISIYLDERIFSLYPDQFRQQTVIPILLDNLRDQIKAVRQVMTLAGSDAETSHLLRIPISSPIANVRRLFTNHSDEIIYYAEVVYRGDAISLEMELKV
ncbi:GntR family transcriptional regulator [Izhakiella australiensis]|uniref:GntR family transcriptional regulator n=1 Tax=Izhakiella australiensis TaxID=1926881 RepID=A0A1S8YT76_9GAMM|nr:GntR family transcriptional regulator [Izhakiella australiensis]OON42075.1 GntR family transcriptional regulator [Izhakiella australiensis]